MTSAVPEIGAWGERAEALVVTAESELADPVLAAGVAAGVRVGRLGPGDPSLRAAWSSARVVFVGLDAARAVIEAELAPHPAAHVVGVEADLARLCEVSPRLGAAVVSLPGGARWLADLLVAVRAEAVAAGRLTVLVGGSGGVGASTTAAGLASRLAGSAGAALVDADPASGGLDLVLGAEREPGWRWDRLQATAGRLGTLRGQVPCVDGVDVVAMPRGEGVATGALTGEALTAVVASLRADHAHVVVDIGRGGWPGADHLVHAAGRVVVVARGGVVELGAAAAALRRWRSESAELGLVLRPPLGRRGGVAVGEIADVLGARVVATLPDDPVLPRCADAGVAPWQGAGRSWRRAVDTVGEWCA